MQLITSNLSASDRLLSCQPQRKGLTLTTAAQTLETLRWTYEREEPFLRHEPRPLEQKRAPEVARCVAVAMHKDCGMLLVKRSRAAGAVPDLDRVAAGRAAVGAVAGADRYQLRGREEVREQHRVLVGAGPLRRSARAVCQRRQCGTGSPGLICCVAVICLTCR